MGGTDGGLIGAWSSTASRSPAPAAVVIYRTFQLGLPAILGAIALVQLRRSLRQSDTSAKLCAPLSDGAPERAAAG